MKYSISSHIKAILFLLTACATVLLSCQACSTGNASASGAGGGASDLSYTAPEVLSTFEGGTVYKAGELKVLKLSGTWKEMGRQYGRLFSDDLKAMYDTVVKQYIENKLIDSESQLTEFSKKQFSLYPVRFQQMADGMVETSTITRDQLACLNSFFEQLTQAVSPQKDSASHCSCISAWGEYTGNGPLVMGRDFDFPPFYRNMNKYVSLVVYNPSDGARSAAVITYPGQIGSIQVFNDQGLVLENNDGSSSGDTNRYFGERIPFPVKDLGAMMDCPSLESLDAALKTNRMEYPLIYNVAAPDRAYCYEMTTSDVKRREGENGLLIGVNHFMAPGWPEPPSSSQTTISDSKTRYNNMKAQADARRGSIDAQAMMGILDVTVENGGPTPASLNIYQYVAVPQQLKIWIKIRDYMDWTAVDLSSLFKK